MKLVRFVITLTLASLLFLPEPAYADWWSDRRDSAKKKLKKLESSVRNELKRTESRTRKNLKSLERRVRHDLRKFDEHVIQKALDEIERPFMELLRFQCRLEHGSMRDKSKDKDNDGYNDEWKHCFDNEYAGITVSFDGSGQVVSVGVSGPATGNVNITTELVEGLAQDLTNHIEFTQLMVDKKRLRVFEFIKNLAEDGNLAELESALGNAENYHIAPDVNLDRKIYDLIPNSDSIKGEKLLDLKLSIKQEELETNKMLLSEFENRDTTISRLEPAIVAIAAFDMPAGILRDILGVSVARESLEASGRFGLGVLKTLDASQDLVSSNSSEELALRTLTRHHNIPLLPDSISSTFIFAETVDEGLDYKEHSRDIRKNLERNIKRLETDIEQLKKKKSQKNNVVLLLNSARSVSDGRDESATSSLLRIGNTKKDDFDEFWDYYVAQNK